VTPDGAHVVSGAMDGRTSVWDLISGRFLRNVGDWSRGFFGGECDVRCVAVTCDRVVEAHGEGVHVWDMASGRLVRQLVWDQSLAVAVTPDGARVASLRGDDPWPDNQAPMKWVVWDVASGEVVRLLSRPSSEALATSLALRADGAQVVTGLYDGSLVIWDVT